ncbi:hypothetical protein K402DRAFT_314337, partial [Aulographum hederae CBS 113979]
PTDVSSTIFESLNGEWNFHRILDSKLAHTPSGVVTGTATYTARPPTDSKAIAEYMYAEEGSMTMENGLTFTTRRRYIWRLSPSLAPPSTTTSAHLTTSPPTSNISVFFVAQDNETSDGLFHSMDMNDAEIGTSSSSSAATSKNQISACGNHFCAPDQYETDYKFNFGDTGESGTKALTQFRIVYNVKGPNKDYVSHTIFTR